MAKKKPEDYLIGLDPIFGSDPWVKPIDIINKMMQNASPSTVSAALIGGNSFQVEKLGLPPYIRVLNYRVSEDSYIHHLENYA